MRILRVAQKLYPEHKGGGPYHVHAMSRDQAAMGHDVTVLTVAGDADLPRREERDGYTIVRQTPIVQFLGNDISVGMARFLREANQFDVIHAHSHLYFSTNLAALKGRLGNIPLAITNHGLYSQNAPEWLFDAYLRTIGKWTFNSADVVFCYTETDKRRVRELGVRTDIEVVPNGVDVSRFTPEGSKTDLIVHDGPVILFVGRLVDGKRPQDAIDAVNQLPKELDAKLYVVGEGPLRPELEARADGDVEFLGQISYDKMPPVYRSGDALILPSRAEGLPRTVLEAFASGIPVVSSYMGHTANLVEKAGETATIEDIDGFSEAIKRILEQREQLASRGRSTVVTEYRWEETVTETTERLREIARIRRDNV